MSPTRRKQVRRETDPVNELDVHAGKFGFVLKGMVAKRWAFPVLFLVILVAATAVGVWTLKSFPDLLHWSKTAADKTATIEQKVDEVKKTEAKHHKQLQGELNGLKDSMEAQAEILTDLADELHADAGQRDAAKVASLAHQEQGQ